MKRNLYILILLSFSLSLISENDPFENINRTTLEINKKLDKAVATPVAKFYKRITPDILEIGIYNAISIVDDISIS